MEKLRDYIREALGIDIHPELIPNPELNKLPFYIKQTFHFYHVNLLKYQLVLAEIADVDTLTVQQIEKQFQIISNIFGNTVILIAQNLTSINRKRLIEKEINFIVPEKQLFLPALMMDLRETFKRPQNQKEKLLPSAQVILLYRILKRNKKIEELSLKELAAELKYTPMAITKAVSNLQHFELCAVEGTKEKYLRFDRDIPGLWNDALPLMINPVIKQVYADELPEKLFLMKSNTSALPEYSNMADSRQTYYAIEKRYFYRLKQNGKLINQNDYEGRYCLEVWKYNPAILAEGITEETNVDPLSLYLSLKNSHDERIEMALEKIIEKYIW